MTLVKCGVVDCIFNKDYQCKNSNIEISLYYDNKDICRMECSSYVSDSSCQSE